MEDIAMTYLLTFCIFGSSLSAYIYGRTTGENRVREKLLKNPREYERIRHSYLQTNKS